MLGLRFSEAEAINRRRVILCLGAHSDDIEIGCGATVLEIAAAQPDTQVVWVVFSGDGVREVEARRSARLFLKSVQHAEVIVRDFRDGFFPAQGAEIKEFFEELKKHVSPDIILTHYRDDRHQDHRVVSDLTWNTWRNHLILEYEIPKYDGDLAQPNAFFPVSAGIARQKAKNLCKVFQTQRNRHWFATEVFLGLMRVRGLECCAPSGYAEAFHARKAVIVPPLTARDGKRRVRRR
jgi:LmbE family N-acetylglucosaminyl deacetylase